MTDIEADDAIAIEHTREKGEDEEQTIICSRDKDLRQVPGWTFSWELGKQPEYGPLMVHPVGYLSYDPDKNKLTGNGYLFFASQVLTGDVTDNIPGLPKYGPKKAFDALSVVSEEMAKGMSADTSKIFEDIEDILEAEYTNVYGAEADERLTEQAQLCWIVRRYNEDGSPQLWRQGLYV